MLLFSAVLTVAEGVSSVFSELFCPTTNILSNSDTLGGIPTGCLDKKPLIPSFSPGSVPSLIRKAIIDLPTALNVFVFFFVFFSDKQDN